MSFIPLSAIHRRTGSRHRVLTLVGIAALGAGLMATSQPPSVARASLGVCNGDPVVVLSNGVIIDLNAAIHDDLNDVQQVVYTLHAPGGTGVVSVVYTSGLLGPKEVLRFYGDNPPDTYDTATAVSTYASGIAVKASTTAVPVLGLPAAASTSGFDQQNLHVSVTL